MILMFSIVAATEASAQEIKADSFKVYGNCNMCKKRIEKAAAIEGVTKADWNVQSKIMTVSYDTSRTSSAAIQQKIAAAGHDTEKQKAPDEVYSKLPGCCQYNRKAAGTAPVPHGHHQ